MGLIYDVYVRGMWSVISGDGVRSVCVVCEEWQVGISVNSTESFARITYLYDLYVRGMSGPISGKDARGMCVACED